MGDPAVQADEDPSDLGALSEGYVSSGPLFFSIGIGPLVSARHQTPIDAPWTIALSAGNPELTLQPSAASACK
jgi:hypothetical protein